MPGGDLYYTALARHSIAQNVGSRLSIAVDRDLCDVPMCHKLSPASQSLSATTAHLSQNFTAGDQFTSDTCSMEGFEPVSIGAPEIGNKLLENVVG